MLPNRPKLLDLFCGGGGAAKGYADAGFDLTGVDHVAQPRYPYRFVQAEALEYVAQHGRDYDAIHASPPCQFYSAMRHLPWLRDKQYPQLIEPTRQALEATGRPWVLENVMGAKLQAGFLCGVMFGRCFYRHRYFLSNWLWLAPPHPRHRVTMNPVRRNADDLPAEPGGRLFRDNKGSLRHQRSHRGYQVWTDEIAAEAPPAGVIRPGRMLGKRASMPIFSDAEDSRGAASWPGRICGDGAASHGVTTWQENGVAPGIGHTAGIAEVRREMECEWMTRDELSQAIPPCYTRFVGLQLLNYLG